MIHKAKIRLIHSLSQKKYRTQHRLFVVEGDKMVREMLTSPLTTVSILAKPEWLELNQVQLSNVKEIIAVDDRELSQISFLKTPNQALALVQIPEYRFDITAVTGGLSLYLDQVQDPGNLGTIIRVADWFGIQHVFCGEGSADPYNPKTVQSTMGALTRVKIHEADRSFFEQLPPDCPVYGAFLDGENLYNEPLQGAAVLVMGNESKGIGAETAQYVTRRLFVPSYPPGAPTSESLNVAVATAVICAEFRRR